MMTVGALGQVPLDRAEPELERVHLIEEDALVQHVGIQVVGFSGLAHAGPTAQASR